MNIEPFKDGVDTDITDKTAPRTIPPLVVGNKLKDLADITKAAVELNDNVGQDVLNLNTDRFKEIVLRPGDRTDTVFSGASFLGAAAFYYEDTAVGDSGSILKNLFIKAYAPGTVSVGFFTISSNTATVIYTKSINVVEGVNQFGADSLALPPDVLNLPLYYVALRPIASGILAYEPTGGNVKLFPTAGGDITPTQSIMCMWLEVELNSNFVLTSYPETKSLLNDAVNLVNSAAPQIIPFDKTALVFTDAGGLNTFYTESEIKFSKNNLSKVIIMAKAAGIFTLRFCSKAGGLFTILHTYTGTVLAAGKFVVDASTIGLPDLSAHESVYVFVGNRQSGNPNVLNFNFDGAGISRDWYLMTDAGDVTVYNSLVLFGFWIESIEDNKLVREVLRLQAAVENITVGNYDYQTNFPVLPGQIYLLNDRATPIYKKSLFQKLLGTLFPDVNILSNRKMLNINEPTYINQNDVAASGRFLINKSTELGQLVYKDVEFIKATLADKVGRTIKVMSLGDSLTEGGTGVVTSSPIFLLKQALTALGITVQTVGTLQRTNGGNTIQYEGRGGWRYRTFVGLESTFASLNVLIPSQTKQVWIEGVDGDMNVIKANNVFLYPATAQDKIDFPQWCFHFVDGAMVYNTSYAQNPGLGTYFIFNPAKYLSERAKDMPDVLTIALGTNEWYLNDYGGFNLTDASNCADWMIARFRQAMPATKIIVIPCNNMPTSKETDWQNSASKLAANIIKIIDTRRANGDANLFGLSIFAHGSRVLAYDSVYGDVNLSATNNTKRATVDTDVHMLNSDDDSRADYMDALVTCVTCVM